VISSSVDTGVNRTVIDALDSYRYWGERRPATYKGGRFNSRRRDCLCNWIPSIRGPRRTQLGYTTSLQSAPTDRPLIRFNINLRNTKYRPRWFSTMQLYFHLSASFYTRCFIKSTLCVSFITQSNG